MLIFYSIMCASFLLMIVYGRYRNGGHKGFLCFGASVLILQMVMHIFNGESWIKKQRLIEVKSEESLKHSLQERYLHLISWCLLSCMALQGLGVVYCYQEEQCNRKAIVLERDTYGGEEVEYSLLVTVGDQVKEMVAVISPKEYTKKEKDQLFQEGFDKAWKQVLGQNQSLNEVSYSLHFQEDLEGYSFQLTWWCEDDELIDSEGKVHSENVGEEQTTVVYLQLKYGEDIRQQSMPVVLIPPSYSKEQLVLKAIQDKIGKLNKQKRESNSVSIPKRMGGIEVGLKEDRKQPIIFFVISILVPLLFFLKNRQDYQESCKKRKEELLSTYPELVNQLILYLGAGLTIKNCFVQIVEDYQLEKRKGKPNNYLYEECMVTVQELRTGAAEVNCYEELGQRLMEKQYRKLMSLLTQNLSKGSHGILVLLNQEVQEAFGMRKENAKRFGEEASTKLLFPMILELLVVMVVIMVPALLNFGL